jgi:hypothetical protein
MSDDTKRAPDSPDDAPELLELTERGEQTAEEFRRLMELHRDHDERVFGVRPEFILDADRESADWIRDPRHWTTSVSETPPPQSEEPRES